MKRKSAIIVAILIMAIGFASISTTLIINGNARVSENTDDFSVIFTAASLDGTDVYANAIDNTKKVITFETNELKTLNQTSILTYEVTNNSSNYDAEVQVNCKVKDNSTAKYTSIKNEFEGNTTKVLAKETLNGMLTVTLNKTSIEEVREEYVCVLTFNALERDSLGYDGPTEWTFDYTGGEQTFEVPVTGTYKLETWGAQGGNGTNSYIGGYGGYSTGQICLNRSKKIYINIGGSGKTGTCAAGGYNGGGISGDQESTAGSGGGATHIASITGILSSLKNNINSILIVSGSGGGGGYYSGGYYGIGGSGGGYIGNNGTSSKEADRRGMGGTQITGGVTPFYANNFAKFDNFNGNFGQGGTYNNSSAGSRISGGGGSGYYGGSFGGDWGAGGGGGSGYIGNSLLTNKLMYCYNCTESTEESTKTISTTCTSATPTENCAKSGNGYARITLIK